MRTNHDATVTCELFVGVIKIAPTEEQKFGRRFVFTSTAVERTELAQVGDLTEVVAYAFFERRDIACDGMRIPPSFVLKSTLVRLDTTAAHYLGLGGWGDIKYETDPNKEALSVLCPLWGEHAVKHP